MNEADVNYMNVAIAQAQRVRCITSPNPWVGCCIVSTEGEVFVGATYESTRDHAEVHALRKAGDNASGATVYVTLEPCSHVGTTPACAVTLVKAGVSRVVIGIQDPDEKVSGKGISHLRDAGIEVEVGVCADEISEQLAAYVTQRTTSRPYVILKLGTTLDGYIADAHGTSQWITGDVARADDHRVRAESDAILVGANTVRLDNPTLTVRDWTPEVLPESDSVDPMRIVLGHADLDKNIQPCREMQGDLGDILDTLGSEGVLQLLVEGGAGVAHDFHAAGLVDRYVFYIAPALFGGGDAIHSFGEKPASTLADIWRGKFVSVEQLGSDIRIDCVPCDIEEK